MVEIKRVRFFADVCGLRDEALAEALGAAAAEKIYGPKESILEPGRKPENFWFLAEGVIRSYCMDEGGREITDMFISRPGAVSNSILFDGIEISGEKAVDRVTVLEVPCDTLRELFGRYSELQRFLFEQIRDYGLRYWYLCGVSTGLMLPERLKWFQSVDPRSSEAANNVQLASFFGASRESISRMLQGTQPEPANRGRTAEDFSGRAAEITGAGTANAEFSGSLTFVSKK